MTKWGAQNLGRLEKPETGIGTEIGKGTESGTGIGTVMKRGTYIFT